MDYVIWVELKSGATRQTGYGRLLDVLGLAEESYLGEPLKSGTPAGLRYVLVVLKGGFPEIKKVSALDENGALVASFGIDFDLLFPPQNPK